MLQDYGINVTIEWLKNTSARKFNVLISGFTKNTAVGQKIMAEVISKNKSVKGRKPGEQVLKFTPTKGGVQNLQTWAKGFKKK